MTQMHPSKDIRPISLFGDDAQKLLREVRKNQRPLFLTSKGEAAGVLMDIAEYERLIELVEFRENVRASMAEAERGEVVSHEQIVKESKLRIKAGKKQSNIPSKNEALKVHATSLKRGRSYHADEQARLQLLT